MKKNFAKILALVLCIFYTEISSAVECNQASTELGMRQCVTEEYSKLDKQLNKIYSEYRGRLNDVQKQQLKEAQLAWVKFRDLACKFEASGVEGGSAHQMVVTQCLSQKTRGRISEIERLLNCEEGDLSCPAWK
jgi:uncharacterized protein YecT (DUF1311 family)